MKKCIYTLVISTPKRLKKKKSLIIKIYLNLKFKYKVLLQLNYLAKLLRVLTHKK